MTTDNHTPITTGAAANASVVNAPLSELDAAINSLISALAAKKLDDLAAPDDNTDLNTSVSAHGLMQKLTGSDADVFLGDGTWGANASGSGLGHTVQNGGVDLSQRSSLNFTGVLAATDNGGAGSSDISFSHADTALFSVGTTSGSALIDIGSSGSATPATPASDVGRLWVKNDGTLHFIDDTGADTDLMGSTGSGGTVTGTAGEALSERDVVYLKTTDSEWYKVDIDAATLAIGATRGIVTESGGISSAATGEITVYGEVSGFSGLTIGGSVYASATAGGHTQTKPTLTKGGSQQAIVVLGFASSTTSIMVVPGTDVKFLKRDDVAADGTMTVEHYADEPEQSRQVGVFLSTTVSAVATENASSTQDVDVGIQGLTNYTADLCTGGTPLKSSEYTGGGHSDVASNAFDDDDGTYWACDNESPDGSTVPYIGYDFGLGVTKTIKQYTLTSRADNGMFPTAWKLQHSSDNSSWTDADTQTAQSFSTGGETKSYTVSGTNAKRYWRILVTAVTGSGTYASVAELEMMEALSATKLAQSFQISGAASIPSVNLWLKKTGSPTGNLTAKIYTDSGDEPNALVSNGTSDTVAASTLSTSYGWIEFEFSTSPSLSATTSYWIVLETTDSEDGSNYVSWGADGSAPSYANGEMKAYKSAAWAAENKDSCFQVLQPSTTYDEPIGIGSWSLEDEKIACRFDDGSGSDTTTKTTFKNKHSATLDVTCEVRLP